MKLKPLGDCIIVKQHDEETKTASGLILAVTADKKAQGEIMAVGTGKILEDGTVRPMEVKVGDIILFGEYAKQPFKLEGVEYLVMHEADVIGIVEN